MINIGATSTKILTNMLADMLEDNPTKLEKTFKLDDLAKRQNISYEQAILCINYLADCGCIKLDTNYSEETRTRNVTITARGIGVAEQQ